MEWGLVGYLDNQEYAIGNQPLMEEKEVFVSNHIEELVDKISAVFVPVVVICAILASFTWMFFSEGYGDYNSTELAIMVLVSTLVIACPCALGLATPTALMVGTGVGAQFGLLIKGIDAVSYTHLTLPTT